MNGTPEGNGTYLARVTNPYSETTIFQHDNVGRSSTAIYGNNVYQTYTYDDQNRITDIAYLNNGAASTPFETYDCTYDAGGRIKTLTQGSNGQISTYSYDDANQLTEKNVVLGVRSRNG